MSIMPGAAVTPETAQYFYAYALTRGWTAVKVGELAALGAAKSPTFRLPVYIRSFGDAVLEHLLQLAGPDAAECLVNNPESR
jgi:hypothetical protein